MHKVSTLFMFALLLCGVNNVYAVGERSNLQKILPETLTMQGISDESIVETTQIEPWRQEEEKVESMRRITDVMYEKAKLFGAKFVLLETIMDSNSLLEQYGPGQSKIMTMGATTSLRYDLTVLLAEKFQSGNFGRSPLLSTSGTVFRNEKADYSHLAEFSQFELDKFLSTSLEKYRGIYPDKPSKYMIDDVGILEFAVAVLEELKIPFKIRLNHREMVWYMAKLLKIDAVAFQNVLDVLDKSTNKKQSILDFISSPEIRKISQYDSRKLIYLLQWNSLLQDNPSSLISLLLEGHRGNKQVEKALLELQTIISLFPPEKAKYIMLDLTLARGANYYEGTIFEIFTPTERGVGIGALFGGGRFKIKDSVTGKESFGVGAAFGVDRVFLALKELKMTKAPEKRTAVIGEDTALVLNLARQLRTNGFSVSAFSTLNEDVNLRNFELILKIIKDTTEPTIMSTMKPISSPQVSQILQIAESTFLTQGFF